MDLLRARLCKGYVGFRSAGLVIVLLSVFVDGLANLLLVGEGKIGLLAELQEVTRDVFFLLRHNGVDSRCMGLILDFERAGDGEVELHLGFLSPSQMTKHQKVSCTNLECQPIISGSQKRC